MRRTSRGPIEQIAVIAITGLLVCVAPASAADAAAQTYPKAPTTLDTAWSLANARYKGWTYAKEPDEAKQQIDCDHFILAVIEQQLGRKLTKDGRRAVLIGYGWKDEDTQKYAEAGTDERLGGGVPLT